MENIKIKNYKMNFRLKYKKISIVDIEVYKKDNYIEISSVVCIEPYSELLIKLYSDDPIKASELIETFSDLQELRGWLWEVYFMDNKNTIDKYDDVVEDINNRLKEVASKFDLFLIKN